MSIWFYYNEKGEKVKITGGQLKGLAKAGQITPDTMVETENGKSAPAGKVKGLTFGEVTQPNPRPATTSAIQYFFTDASGQRGLINAQQLKALAVQGLITPDTELETDTGHKGKAGQIKGLFATVPPAVPPPPSANSDEVDDEIDIARTIKTLNTYFKWCWMCPVVAFVSLFALGFFGGILSGIFGNPDLMETFMPILFGFFMIAVIVGYIFLLMLLYQLWKVIPADIAQTTPGQAVGCLFIPLFNLYWRFIAYWKLGKNMNQTLQRYGNQYTVNENLGLTACILLLIPYIGFIGYFVLFFYLKSVKDGAIALLEQEDKAYVQQFDVQQGRKNYWIIGCCVGSFLLIPLMIALLLPAVQAAREAARRMQCSNNMKQVAFALHNYHDVHGALPPLYTVDTNGRPLHSWRVLILPYIEHGALYEQIRLDEPWDSPYNSQFHSQIIGIYRCPSGRNIGGTNNCVYAAIMGGGFIPADKGKRTFGDFKSELSNTIAVIEVKEPFCWMNPTADLTLDDLSKGVNAPDGRVGSFHPGSFLAAFLDGRVLTMSNSINPAVLRALGESGAPPVSIMPTRTEQVSSLQTHRDDKYGFSFQYPAGWQRVVRPADIPDSLVLVAGRIDGSMPPLVNILAAPEPDVSNEDLLSISQEAFQSVLEEDDLNKVKFKDFGIKEIGGKKWLFCHYQATAGEDNFPVETLHLSSMHNGKEFTILARDSQANFGKNRSAFDSIINSFRFD